MELARLEKEEERRKKNIWPVLRVPGLVPSRYILVPLGVFFVMKTLGDECLHGCDVSSIGARALAEGLQENNSLEELDLQRNWIGDDGALSLGDALKVNHSLKTLRLYGNEVSSLKQQQLTQEYLSRVLFWFS